LPVLERLHRGGAGVCLALVGQLGPSVQVRPQPGAGLVAQADEVLGIALAYWRENAFSDEFFARPHCIPVVYV
jgi:hypothetical protein